MPMICTLKHNTNLYYQIDFKSDHSFLKVTA